MTTALAGPAPRTKTALADLGRTDRVRRAAATSKDAAPESKARRLALAASARAAKAVPARVVRLARVPKAAPVVRRVLAAKAAPVLVVRPVRATAIVRSRGDLATCRDLRTADRNRDLRTADRNRDLRTADRNRDLRIADRNRDLRVAAVKWVRPIEAARWDPLLVVREIAVLKDAPDSGRVRTVGRWDRLPSPEVSAARSAPVSEVPDAAPRRSNVV